MSAATAALWEHERAHVAPVHRLARARPSRGGSGELGDERVRPGRPLDDPVRSAFEARLGHDFGRVRIHTDESAAESAQALHAAAYTVGTDVTFAAGRYAPGTIPGDTLLAHELAHVVQAAGTQQAPMGVSASGDAHEQAADRVVAELATGGDAARALRAGSAPPLVHRQQAGLRPPEPTPGFRRPPLRLVPELRLRLPPGLAQIGTPIATAPVPAHGPLLLSPAQLAQLATRPLPRNVSADLIAGATAEQAPSGHKAGAGTVAGGFGMDVGVNVSGGQDVVAPEVFVAVVLDADAAQAVLRGVQVDLLHQPTAQFTFGLEVSRGPTRTVSPYLAAQIAVTVANLHLPKIKGRELFELALPQIGIGFQGGQPQVQVGAQLETHVREHVSLVLAGGVTLTPSSSGWSVAPSPFQVALVWKGVRIPGVFE